MNGVALYTHVFHHTFVDVFQIGQNRWKFCCKDNTYKQKAEDIAGSYGSYSWRLQFSQCSVFDHYMPFLECAIL